MFLYLKYTFFFFLLWQDMVGSCFFVQSESLLFTWGSHTCNIIETATNCQLQLLIQLNPLSSDYIFYFPHLFFCFIFPPFFLLSFGVIEYFCHSFLFCCCRHCFVIISSFVWLIHYIRCFFILLLMVFIFNLTLCTSSDIMPVMCSIRTLQQYTSISSQKLCWGSTLGPLRSSLHLFSISQGFLSFVDWCTVFCILSHVFCSFFCFR